MGELGQAEDPWAPVIDGFRRMVDAVDTMASAFGSVGADLIAVLGRAFVSRSRRGWKGRGAPTLWYPATTVWLNGRWPITTTPRSCAQRPRKRPGRPRWRHAAR